MADPALRIVVADDAFLVREALKHLLALGGFTVVGECEDATQVEPLIVARGANVLITDIRMPPTHTDEGIRLAERLRATHPEVGVVVLSKHAEVDYALRVFEHGSDGRAYLLKDRVKHRDQLFAAAQAVANGSSLIDSMIVEGLLQERALHASRLGELTEREIETLSLVAQGLSNAAIAEQLVLSKRAVEKHINAIFAKLDLGETELVSRRVRAALLYLADRDLSARRLLADA